MLHTFEYEHDETGELLSIDAEVFIIGEDHPANYLKKVYTTRVVDVRIFNDNGEVTKEYEAIREKLIAYFYTFEQQSVVDKYSARLGWK